MDGWAIAKVLLEALPATGTFAVAWLVFRSSKTQQLFDRRIAQRAAALDEQTLRVSLLDRRAALIGSMRDIHARFEQKGSEDIRLLADARQVFDTALLLWPADLQSPIDTLLVKLLELVGCKRMQKAHARSGNEAARLQTVDRQSEIEHELLRIFPKVISHLISASRVDALPSIS